MSTIKSALMVTDKLIDLQLNLVRSYNPIVCCYGPRLVQLFGYLQCRLGRFYKPIVSCYGPRLVQLFEYLQCRLGRSYKPNVCCYEPRLVQLLKHLQCRTIFSVCNTPGGQLRHFLGCIPLFLNPGSFGNFS